jgi:phosphoglycolate phosphatase-like HAD superfamily hydrolase
MSNVFVLDFDGVLCDSAAETAVTAWRAGQSIWPHWQGGEPPAEYRQRFIKLRPVVETGYQTIPLMGLITKGLDDERIASHFHELCDELLQEIDYPREQCARLFNEARAHWMRQDLSDWLSRQRFYPLIIERFREKLNAEWPLFILTTKQERFIEALLKGQGIVFPKERIFGLDTGQKKEDTLEELLQWPDLHRATWHFVEDRLATLLRILQRESLNRVRLYLASWGYNMIQDREQARLNKAITLWNPEQFLVV